MRTRRCEMLETHVHRSLTGLVRDKDRQTHVVPLPREFVHTLEVVVVGSVDRSRLVVGTVPVDVRHPGSPPYHHFIMKAVAPPRPGVCESRI
jgi:hypothetical protein